MGMLLAGAGIMCVGTLFGFLMGTMNKEDQE